MSSSKIAEYIEDPHQKMVYVYDPSEKWTLMIELLKIVPLDSTANYPMLSKSEGTAPKQYKQNIVAPVVDEDEEDEVDSNIKEKYFQQTRELMKWIILVIQKRVKMLLLIRKKQSQQMRMGVMTRAMILSRKLTVMIPKNNKC